MEIGSRSIVLEIGFFSNIGPEDGLVSPDKKMDFLGCFWASSLHQPLPSLSASASSLVSII